MLKTNPSDFENILPYLKMLNAKAAYAMGRDLVSKGFKDFISNSLNQIKDKDDFDAFAALFEAFMGYYKYYDEKGESLLAQGGRR
jgi:CRISPR-associated protein Csm2